MLTRRGNDPWAETLEGLHTPAWWTGLRLVAADGWNTVYRVRLRQIAGLQSSTGNQRIPAGNAEIHDRPGFPLMANECEWTQVSGDWHPLPFAVPATMASLTGMELVVTPTDNAPRDLITSVKIGFQEMPQLRETDRYLFCDDDGRVVHMWDGRRQVCGTPQEGSEPEWRSLHTVVPTMKWLMHMPWLDEPFCIHAWDERVPMRGRQQV